MMDAELKKRLKARSRLLDPLVRVGKNGLTDSTIDHIKLMVKKKRLVKIKLLRSFVDASDKKKAAKELAEKTGTEIVDQIGLNVVIYKASSGRPVTKKRMPIDRLQE